MRNKIILVLVVFTLLVTLKAMFPRETQHTEFHSYSKINKELEKFPGKEVFDSYQQWLTLGDKKNFLATVDFLKLLNQPEINLDKDVYLDMGIFIEKPVRIKGGSSRKKIYIYNTSVAISIFENNILFEDVDFHLTNVNFFVQSRKEKLGKEPENIEFKNCKFYIYGKTNLTFESSNLTIKKSLFLNQRKTFIPESSLLWVSGSNIKIQSNTFLDLNGAVNYPVYIAQSLNVFFEENSVVVHQSEMKALVTVSNSKNIYIKNNFLYDTNPNLKSLALTNAPTDEEEIEIDENAFIEGGIGVWYAGSEKVNIENNLLSVPNEVFNQQMNENIRTREIVKTKIFDDFSLDCSQNEKLAVFLRDKFYLNCRNL